MKPLAQERVHPADTRTARTRRIEAILVSGDDGFLIELGPLLGDRFRTRTVDHPDAIGVATDTTRWVAIVDALALPDARATVARLEKRFPSAEIIVVTKTSEEWTSAVSRGAVMATIAREHLGGARMLALLAAAESRLAAHADAAVAGAARPASIRTSAGDWRAPPSPSSLRLVVTFAVVGMGCAGLLWWLAPASAYNPLSGLDIDSAASDHKAAVAPVSVLELLSSARIAFQDQKLLPRADGEGRGESALELYMQVLRREPANDEALDGVRRLFTVGKARIQSDLASGRFDDAGHLLGFFKNAGVEPEALHEVETSIAAARSRWLAAKAQQSSAASEPSGSSDPATRDAARGGAASYIAARPLTPINVAYPAAVADSGIQGYVVVEFTLHADGIPSNPTVVEAQPASVFDHAAITAVMHARFDGSGLVHRQSRRARIRLTFKPS